MEMLEHPRLCNSENNAFIEINSIPFTVGRGLICDYIIPDKVISRVHCTFEKYDNQWFFKDSSTNGTYLNKLIIHNGISPPLKDCDIVQLAADMGYKFKFQLYPKEDITDEQLCRIADSVLEDIETSNSNQPSSSSTVLPLRLSDANEVIVVTSNSNTPLSDSVIITDPILSPKRMKVSHPISRNTVIDLTEDSFSAIDMPSTSTNPPTNSNVIDLSSSIKFDPSTTSNNFQIVPSTTSDLKMKIQKIPNLKSEKTTQPSTSDKTNAESKEDEEDSQIEDELLCAICSEMFVKATTLSCSHTFCRYCINIWKSKQSVCPICRTKITSLVPTLVLDNVIEKAVHTLSKGAQEHRQELLKERMNSDQSSTATVPSEVNTVMEIDSNEEVSSLTSSDTDNTDDMEEEYWDDDWYDGRRRRPYYGGYGTCYVCHNPGHWANSCPFR